MSVTYEDNPNILRPLLIMLNNFLRPGSPNPIPEIVYRSQMSETGTLPGDRFYPRAIITYIKSMHEAGEEYVLQGFRPAEIFCYSYHDEGQARTHEFSNKMPLYADIIVLQYLFVLRRKYGGFPPQTNQLTSLMLRKYMILDDICEKCGIICESCETDCENDNCIRNHPTRITLNRIFHSFLSVTVWMYKYIPELADQIRSVLPSSTFSPMIGSPNLFLVLSSWILPHTSNTFLLASNLAVCVAHDPKPILQILHHMMQCYVSFDVYTENIRTDICNKLGIAKTRNGMYIYGRNFVMHTDCYIRARYKIRSIRPHDESLRDAFLILRQLFYNRYEYFPVIVAQLLSRIHID